jgi:Uma2 family endonuclease
MAIYTPTKATDEVVYPDIPPTPIYYPESDGKPMAETDTHRRDLMYAVEAIDEFFRDHDDVYVSGNLLVYYQQGEPSKSFAPDCFVVFGIPKIRRRSYKIWEESGHVPAMIIEFTSNSTKADDSGSKKGLYAFLGVKEYYLFDPTGDYLPEPLMGYALHEGNYQPRQAASDGSLVSPLLGLRLKPEGELLRLYDVATGAALPLYGEAVEIARQQTERAEVERARAEAERARAEAAEQRVAELLAELARLRGEAT